MKRYLITFAYDGSGFCGYQKQPKTRTIQSEIENALKKINGGKVVSIHASGRTDALVHAYNQKAHFDMDINIELDHFAKAINALLPNDIFIKEVEVAKSDFDARKNCKAKEYIYKINIGEYNPLERNYVYQFNKQLDLVSIARALKYLEGEHDFSSFTPTSEKRENYVREIKQTNMLRDVKNLNEITFVFLGTGFLKYQVRNMVGTLIEVGENKIKPEEILDIINAKDRTAAGPTANPEGLYLNDVYY